MSASPKPPDFGKALRRARHDSGVTQAALAFRTGVDTKTIFRYETNQSSPPVHFVIRVCRTLDITPDELLGFKSRGAA